MLIAGNWKMYDGPDPVALREALHDALGEHEHVVAPPFTRLHECVRAGLTTFAQNVHWEPEGAYTGEVSARMLLERGVAGALVGHSERRQYFGETDTTVARRTHAALHAGLRVIACVGETGEERESGDTETVLRIQVEAIRDACGEHERLVLAYEPVWAIGTGKTATPEQAQEVHAFIRHQFGTLYTGAIAEATRLLYGGSVKPDNMGALMAQPDIDGGLVGGACLEVDSFSKIIHYA